MTPDGPRLTRRRALAVGGTAVGALALGGVTLTGAQDDDGDEEDEDGDGGQDGNARSYRVTVANLTRGQPFTPPAVALHRPDVEVFSVGEPANGPTRALAENGDLGPLVDLIQDTNSIRAAAVGDGPLVPEADPGKTGHPYYATLHLSADASARHLTFVSMLIATNDGIVGLDTVELPTDVNESATFYANGYDVGTEQNTERFGDLVPPAKTLIIGGEPEGTAESDPAISEDDVIRPHPGIQGDGELPPSVYDWREPAGVVQVERVDGFQTEFHAELSGDNEVPPVDSDASGQATVEYDESAGELTFTVEVADIEDVVAAHIHCGRSTENGPVGVTLYDDDPFSGDGVLAEGTVGEPDEDNDCHWTDLADVVAAMRRGNAYVNVHTTENPAGEIRGQLR
jgi:hypothetical protein